ncbi:HNH endonuclease signature motif containing protein [Nocardioides lijunqiniae]|uniref:HNH endonuclease signature motif containing protein n=1 Tax=Nocardioides lijunqiniae TaxID=2760832 RepID=UPI0018787C5A|nr:HNH endonuclease signature motif containing protein [Nocardioides lijunqiniae]
MTSSPADLLEVMRTTTRTAAAVEVERLGAVIDWCKIYATTDEGDASFGDHGIPLAGDGAPWVSEFAVMELGAALGMSTDAAKRYVGATLETRYRLPRIWAGVEAMELPFYKARWIAEHTMALPEAGAAYVDQMVGFCAHSVSYAEIERQITAAQARFDPEAAEKARRVAADGRRLDVHKGDVSINGTVEVTGTLDYVDACDFDAALSRRAGELKAAGSEESLDVRRSIAAGDLARGYDSLPFDDESDGDDVTEGGFEARCARNSTTAPTEVIVHLHEDLEGVGRLGNTRTPILAETIRTWCGNPNTHVTVKPVRDLADHLHVAAYEIPHRLREQDELVDLTCVFPWCTRPAVRCDVDHTIPFAEGGPTCSCNTAALCRGHHRLKTHGRWTYDVLDRGTYLWHSPFGHLYRRDHTGTHPLDTPTRAPEPERRT